MNHIRATTLLALLLAALPAWAVKPFTADYQANVKGMIQANAQMSLSPAGDGRWNYVLSVNSPIASARQSTTFEERGDAWRPLSGSDSTQVPMKRSQKNAIYDWNKGEARWSGDVKPDRAGPVKLQEGDLDAMLLNLALVRDVAAGKPLKYRMVDNGTVSIQTYQNLGTETVIIAGKPRQATKVSRSTDDKQVIAWIVDGLPVPARILQRKGGKDDLELTLKSVR
ncbi:MAG: DUF3108 domain-containing protein [Thermomonas sp.]|uniref:DUF3108 domain-containing protein n=1 Tax=Thermomonas sp. TaxID=1971895 RepID=UPI0039E6B387